MCRFVDTVAQSGGKMGPRHESIDHFLCYHTHKHTLPPLNIQTSALPCLACLPYLASRAITHSRPVFFLSYLTSHSPSAKFCYLSSSSFPLHFKAIKKKKGKKTWKTPVFTRTRSKIWNQKNPTHTRRWTTWRKWKMENEKWSNNTRQIEPTSWSSMFVWDSKISHLARHMYTCIHDEHAWLPRSYQTTSRPNIKK